MIIIYNHYIDVKHLYSLKQDSPIDFSQFEIETKKELFDRYPVLFNSI